MFLEAAAKLTIMPGIMPAKRPQGAQYLRVQYLLALFLTFKRQWAPR